MLSQKKIMGIAILALLFAIFAYSIGGSTTTNESIFQIEINNTNLAPYSTGHNGTGERIQGITYYANNSPIQLLVYSHANQSGQNAELHLYINNTLVADVSGRPLGTAEQNNKSIITIIPRYASYMVEVNNYHHYEWREYRVLSGQNGSVNLTNNYYNINGSIDNTSLNLKVNTSGDNMTGILNMSNKNISDINTISVNNGINIMSKAYIYNYSISTTATATGVLTLNVSNSVGVNNDSLIYFNGHANNNFSDVYFTQNTNLIPFNNTESNPGVFYLNITSLAYPIVVHYSNKSINNLGNGNNTFDIYADGSTLEKFNTNGVTLSSGNISIAANVAGGNYLTTKSKVTRPYVAVYDLTVPNYYSISGYSNASGLQNEGNLNQIIFYAAGDNNFYSEYHDSSSSSSVNIGSRPIVRHTQKLLWRNTSTDTKFYIDSAQKTSPASNFPSLTSLYFSISSHNNFNVANILVDNILMYKYSDGKFNTWGSENTSITPATGQLYCITVDASGNLMTDPGEC